MTHLVFTRREDIDFNQRKAVKEIDELSIFFFLKFNI